MSDVPGIQSPSFQEKDLQAAAKELASGRWDKGVAALAGVVVAALSNHPILGGLVAGTLEWGLEKLLAKTATRRLLAAKAEDDCQTSEQREALVSSQLYEILSTLQRNDIDRFEALVGPGLAELGEQTSDQFVSLVRILRQGFGDAELARGEARDGVEAHRELLEGIRDRLARIETSIDAQRGGRSVKERAILDFAHWDPRSRGVEAGPGWYFSGRRRLLETLCSWLDDPTTDDRIRVVTGCPGSGKSAVLARLVMASKALSRSRIPASELSASPSPREGAVDIAVHARQKRVRQVLEAIAAQAGVLVDASSETLSVESLLPVRERPWVLLFDALDEAAEPQELARRLIRPLAQLPHVRVIVGTRSELIRSLQPRVLVLDLDGDEFFAESDVARYVQKRLLCTSEPTRRTPYRDQPLLATRLAEIVARRARQVFLVARLLAETLIARDAVVSPDDELLTTRFPENVGEAFEAYLDCLGRGKTRAIHLLSALAYAQGAGLPWDEWSAVVSEIWQRKYSHADVEAVCGQVRSFLTEDQAYGGSVFRLYHEALAEYLRTKNRALERAIHKAFVLALERRVPESPRAARGKEWVLVGPSYTSRHLAEHAVRVGELNRLMQDPGFLVMAEPDELLGVLATAGDVRLEGSVYRRAAHLLRNAQNVGDALSRLGWVAFQLGASEFAVATGAIESRRAWWPTWAQWQPISAHRVLEGHRCAVTSVAVLDVQHRKLIASGDGRGNLRFWDARTGAAHGQPLKAHHNAVTCLAPLNLGEEELLVSAGEDGALRVWDVRALEQRRAPMLGHTTAVTALTVFEQRGRPLIASSSSDGCVRFWEPRTGQCTHDFTEHYSALAAAVLCVLDGAPVVVVASGWLLKLLDARTGAPWGVDHSREDDDSNDVLLPFEIGNLWVFGPEDRPKILATSRGEEFCVLDLRTRELGPRVEGVAGLVDVVTCGATHFGVSTDDHQIQVWDVTTGARRGFSREYSVGPVTAFEQDGRVAVAMVHDHGLELWNAEELMGETIKAPFLQPKEVTTLTSAVVNGERVLLFGGRDGSIEAWGLGVSARRWRLVGHTWPVKHLRVVNVDGLPILLSRAADGVRFWDLRAMSAWRVVPDALLEFARAHVHCMSSDGELLVVALTNRAENSDIDVWSSAHGDKGLRIYGLMSRPTSLAAFELDGELRVAIGSRSERLRFCNLAGMWRDTATDYARAATALIHITVNERSALVMGSEDGSIQLLDLATRKRDGAPLQGHSDRITSLCISQRADDAIIISGSRDHSIRLWSARKHLAAGTLDGHAGPVTGVASFELGDKRLIASASTDGTVRIWEPLTESRHQAMRPVTAVSVLNTGEQCLAVSGHAGGAVRFWRQETGAAVEARVEAHRGSVPCLATRSVGGSVRMVSGASDGTLRAWTFSDGAIRDEQLAGPGPGVTGVSFVELDGRVLVVSGNREGRIQLQDLSTKEAFSRPLYGPMGVVTCLSALSVDGRPLIAAASTDEHVRLWDVRSSRLGRTLGPTGLLSSMTSLELDGEPLLVSGGELGWVRLWSPRTGRPYGRPMLGHSARVTSVATTSHEGRLIVASASEDGTVRLWDPLLGRPLLEVDATAPVSGITFASSQSLILGTPFGLGRIAFSLS